MLKKTELNMVVLTLTCVFAASAQTPTTPPLPALAGQTASPPTRKITYNFIKLIAPSPGDFQVIGHGINDRRQIVGSYGDGVGGYQRERLSLSHNRSSRNRTNTTIFGGNHEDA
jgi:hypothetical protein